MEKKLGLSALTALVLSSMLGAGVFSLPQNMAAVASPSALLIGWAITGVGILFLAFAMLLLTRIRPDLDGGIFTYAREGFGELIGFCSAWGYWLCAVIANVSYLVIVFSALSFFTDTPELRLFGDGNTWQSIVGASVLLWVVHFLVLRGVQTAAGINLVATLAKLLPLGAFVALAALAFQLDTFRLDFSGLALGVTLGVTLALGMILSPRLQRWLMPLVLTSQAIPVFALAPLLVLWLGFGMSAKVAMAVLVIFFPVTSAFFDGLRRVNQEYLDLARSMNASFGAQLRHVRLMAALPALGSGLRMAAAVAPRPKKARRDKPLALISVIGSPFLLSAKPSASRLSLGEHRSETVASSRLGIALPPYRLTKCQVPFICRRGSFSPFRQK